MPNENSHSEKKATPDKPREVAKRSAKAEDKGEGKKAWDIIDEHAWESFPASDPPASWAGRDISPQEREAQGEESDSKEAASKKKQP
jgi:hypothetical protein